jgi:hypothetical protein
MALQTTLSGDQLTALRSGRYQAFQFVCVVPNEVVVQFNPDSAPTTAVYAEIAVDAVLSGDMADIKQGQTVIFSTGADYQATEVFRTRVRKVSGTSSLYIGENSQSLTTADFITVLNTYEIQEKLRKSETLADWDVIFRKLLPIETALPSAVVLTNDVVAYSPTATPKAMDASATSSFTHAWESSNSSDTLDSGGTTNNPTFTLEAGSFRWIRYTFTDSNSNANFRVIPVWTVPRNYDNPYIVTGFVGESGDVADIAFDAELGWNATVTAWDGIQDLINRTYVVIASDEWYDDERLSIRTNIDFVGFLQNENTPTRGDEAIGRLSETTFAVESFGHQLARQNIAAIRITRVSGTPTAWNQIQNPTPARMLTYHLTEGSTLFHLCSMAVPADDTDFIGDDLSITGGKAYDDMRFITEVINAELQFDVNGKLDLCRNLNFLGDTARDAAAVAATLSPSDVLDYAIEYDYSKTTSSLNMTGGSYNSSSDAYALFEAIAPAVARLSEGDPLEIVNQVLTTNNTAAESLTEISERASNFFAYNNPTPVLRATLKDEWHFITPDIGSWWKFNIVLSDTARGRVFSTDDRWQLVERSVSTNNLTGRRTVTATFRHETQSTGAIIRARQILNNTNADIIYYPPVIAPFVGEDLTYTDNRYFDGFDVMSNSDPNPPEAGCEQGGFRVPDGAYETDSVAETNEEVIITVRGSGRIGLSDWCYSIDLSDWVQDATRLRGEYQVGVGLVGTDGIFFGTAARAINMYKDLGMSVSFNRIEVDYSLQKNVYSPSTTEALTVYKDDHAGTVQPPALESVDAIDGDNQTFVIIGSASLSTIYIAGASMADSFAPYSPYGGYIKVHAVRLYGSGENPFDDDNCEGEGGTDILGDAFYYSTDDWATATPYADGFGLLVEGFQPDAIPPFDPGHEYTLPPMEVTSGPVLYEFESPYPSGELGNWSLQITTCFTNP